MTPLASFPEEKEENKAYGLTLPAHIKYCKQAVQRNSAKQNLEMP